MNETRTASGDIMAAENADQREQVIGLLSKAYWMEIETVMSYIANSVNPDGVRAQEIKESLETDIQEELGHAQQFAARIKELYGVVPGSLEFSAEQTYLQPADNQVDIVHVIKGVIEAESGAIEHYSRIVEETDGIDPVTQDMVIAILHDEQGHKRLFEGFLREYEAEGSPRGDSSRRSPRVRQWNLRSQRRPRGRLAPHAEASVESGHAVGEAGEAVARRPHARHRPRRRHRPRP